MQHLMCPVLSLVKFLVQTSGYSTPQWLQLSCLVAVSADLPVKEMQPPSSRHQCKRLSNKHIPTFPSHASLQPRPTRHRDQCTAVLHCHFPPKAEWLGMCMLAQVITTGISHRPTTNWDVFVRDIHSYCSCLLGLHYDDHRSILPSSVHATGVQIRHSQLLCTVGFSVAFRSGPTHQQGETPAASKTPPEPWGIRTVLGSWRTRTTSYYLLHRDNLQQR